MKLISSPDPILCMYGSMGIQMKDNTGQMKEMRLIYFQIRRTDGKMIKRGRKENQNV